MADEKTIFRNIINRSITDFGDSKIAKVGKHAFHKCISLINVPPKEDGVYVNPLTNVVSIEEKAFKDCTSLKDVKIETDNCSLAEDSFDGCTSLENLYVPKDKYINYKVADNWKYKTPILRGYPYPISVSLNISGIPYSEDKNIDLDGSVTYNDTSSESKLFSNWSAPGIQEFNYIENNSLPIFKNENCVVNNTLSADGYVNGKAGYIVDFQSDFIRNNCFYEDTALKFAAFYKINSIGENAFYGCSNLKAIYLGYNGVVNLVSVSSLPANTNIYVPEAKLNDYKNSSMWSSIATRIFGYNDSVYPKYIKRAIVGNQSVGSAPDVNLIIINNNSIESTVAPTFCIPETFEKSGDQSLDVFYNVGFRFVKLHIDNIKVN